MYMWSYLESSFSNKLQERLFHSVKEVFNEFKVFLIQCLGQSTKPRDEQWLPSQHVGFHVDHATTTHLQQLSVISQKNVCESKECLRVKRMSASQKNVCESKECLRVKRMSASQMDVCEPQECLRVKRMSASQKNVCKSKECLRAKRMSVWETNTASKASPPPLGRKSDGLFVHPRHKML